MLSKIVQAWCQVSFSSYSIDILAKQHRHSLISVYIEEISFKDHEEILLGGLQELLEQFSGTISNEQLLFLAHKLASPGTSSIISSWKAGDDRELTTSYVDLLMAYAEVATESIVRADEAPHQILLRYLFDLMNDRGYPGVEDEYAPRVLGLWISFAEFTANNEAQSFPSEKPQWLISAEQLLLEVFWICMARIGWPPDIVLKNWDDDDMESFKAFRIDVEELALTAFVAHGVAMFDQISQRAQNLFETNQWAEAEVCLWIINALSESSVIHEDNTSVILAGLFNSQLFRSNEDPQLLADPAFIRLRKAELRAITVFADFFASHSAYLYPLLDFLFKVMREPSVATITAKAISTVCSVCRVLLVPRMDVFLDLCLASLRDTSMKHEVKEKLLSATVYIIQAMSSDEERGGPLKELIEAINYTFDVGLDIASSDSDAANLIIVSNLKYLLCVGKALQQPDDGPLDDEKGTISSYWSHGLGRYLQDLTLRIISQASQYFNTDTEVVELCCQIMRTGFNESRPGLLVYTPSVIVDFLLSTNVRTGRLEYVIETTGSMLAKQGSDVPLIMDELCIKILTHSKSLLANPKGDNFIF